MALGGVLFTKEVLVGARKEGAKSRHYVK